MKKFLIFISIAALLLSCFLTGCSGGDRSESTPDAEQEQITSTQTTPEGTTNPDITIPPEECTHTWVDATCTTPKTCSTCSATEGAALGHEASDAATCETAQTCTRCDYVFVAALGHEAGDAATCETAQTCTRCDYVFVAALGHEAGDAATCETAQTCTRCDYVFVEALGHEAGDAATCETAQTCTRCDYVFAGALGHEAGDAATCETAQTCTKCDYVFVEALGHEAGDAATCETAQTCTKCDYVFVEALGHEAGDAATCETAQTCTRCDYVFAGALGHEAGDAATCETAQTCTRCDYVFVVALGHDYIWIVDTAPTFDSEGVKHEECTACHDKRNENTPVDKLTCAHSLTKTEAIAATCLTAGKKEYYTCSVCDKVYSNAEGTLETTVEDCVIAALGHAAGDAATCTTGQTCIRCDYVFQAALGHDIVTDAAVAATCTATGLTEGQHCSRCKGETVAQQVTEALGHEAGDTATCTTAQICIRCDYVFVAALGHDIVIDAAVAATCTATGLTEGSHCSRCDDETVAQQVTEALGHEAGAEATCETAQTCTRCNHVFVEALGHDIVIDAAVAATCTATGLTEGQHCSRCDGETVAQQVTEALGHDIVIDPAIAATCTATGLTEGQHCSRCDGETVAQQITEALGHTWEDATCIAPKTCSACGEVDGIASTEHQINNAGVCTVCGQSFVRTITLLGGKLTSGTYNGDNAEIASPISGIVGEEITLPTPQMRNYNFEGWYLDYACTTPFEGTTFSESLTLYAKWVSNTAQQMTVWSFNVNQPGSSTNASAVIAVINANSPDIVCVQEADQTFMSSLTSNLSGYAGAYWNVSGNTGKNSGLTNAIFVKSATFTASSSNARYPTGTAGGKVSYVENEMTYIANSATYVHYCIVTRKSDNQQFAIVNTQFDADGSNSHAVAEKIRQKELEYLWSQIKGIWDGRGLIPVIVTGDFNATSDSTAYNGMTETYGFIDASAIAKQSTIKNTYTGNGGSIQDYIFVSPNLQHLVESYNVYETNSSDHNALVVKIALPKVICPHKLTKTAATAATCETAGNKEYYTCSSCGTVYVDVYGTVETTVADCVIPALGHDIVIDEAVAATCTATGLSEGSHCTRCDDATVEQQVTDALGHSWVDATCTTPKTCPVCSVIEGEALGHDYKWIVDTEPTVNSEGVKHEECTTCHDTRNENTPIDKLTCTHNLTKTEATDATCLTAGNEEYYTCSICDKVYSNAEGVLETTVMDCTIPALGHDIVIEEALAATCTATGLTEGSHCTRCDDATVVQQVVEAPGHAWVDATCTAPKTCSACSATEGTTLAHQIDDVGICSGCGQSFVRTITFQNGNIGNAVMPAPISGIIGEEITLPVVKMSNYNFEGWYLDYACTKLFTETTFSEDLTLYARWDSNTAQQITVLSFNVNQPGSSTNATSVINAIKANTPDIVCVQEADRTFMSTLTSNLSGYSAAYWNSTSNTGDNSGLTNAIFVKSATFNAYSSNARYPAGAAGGKVSYVENGTTYTANSATYVHYLVVERKSDGAYFAILNTQFDADGSNSHAVAEKIRQKEVEYLWAQIKGIWDGRGLIPVIVVGDFNATANSTAYNGMTQTFGYFDASQVAKQSTIKNTYTGNGGSIQDYIFVSYHLQHLIESYNVYETSSSDHNALVVKIALPDTACPPKLTKTEATAATCLTAGNKEYYTCSTCGRVYFDARGTVETTVEDCIIPALGHEAGAAATCETAQTCTRCDYVFAAALDHVWTNACDTECDSGCGTTRDIIHDYQWVVDTEPTFESEGVKHEECTVCYEKRNENTPVDKLTCAHNLTKTEAIAATCLTAGKKEYYTCSICNKVYSNAEGTLETTVEDCVIAAPGHTWKAATCTSPKTCSACGVTEGEPIAHIWADATCTAPKTCFVCNATEGEPIAHTWKAATCIAPKTCFVCNTTEGELGNHKINSAGVCTACSQNFNRTITFKNGNTGSNPQIPAPISGLVGAEIPTLPVPKMRNYNFEGWYLDSACTKRFTETTFSENLTLYAKWASNTAQQISVLSFNVKTGQSGSNGTLVVDTIRENAPNVFGVQEADSGWMNTLKNQFGSVYTCVGEARGGSIFEGSTEHSAIFYRTDMFNCLESGTKWLSATPDKSGSKYSYTENGTTYTASYPRIMTYVVLQRKSDGAKFLYVNTHLDNNGNNPHDVAEKIRQAEVDIMMKIIKGITDSRGDIPVIVTGDFNSIPENRTAYNAMTKTYGYSDSSRGAKQGEPKTTFTDMTDENSGIILDYIFVSSNLKNAVETYTVCPAKRGGQWVSDHNAIIAKIAVPKVN